MVNCDSAEFGFCAREKFLQVSHAVTVRVRGGSAAGRHRRKLIGFPRVRHPVAVHVSKSVIPRKRDRAARGQRLALRGGLLKYGTAL